MTDPTIQLAGAPANTAAMVLELAEAKQKLAAAEAKLTAMESAPYMRGTRGKAPLSLTLGVAATSTVPVVFDAALPVDTYSPQVTLEGASGVLGSLAVIVQTPLSKTGCTVLVKNSGLISLAVNVTVHVTASY